MRYEKAGRRLQVAIPYGDSLQPKLKSRGYKWDPDGKVWWKGFTEAEQAWLEEQKATKDQKRAEFQGKLADAKTLSGTFDDTQAVKAELMALGCFLAEVQGRKHWHAPSAAWRQAQDLLNGAESKREASKREADAARAEAARPKWDFPTFELSGGSGYGCQGWTKGDIVRSSKKRIDAGGPEYLFVLKASREYVRDDGLSFGVGDEQGYLYEATCRAATDDESAPAREAAQSLLGRTEAKRELEAVAKLIQETGTRPDGHAAADGPNRLELRPVDLYGGGEWFEIEQDAVWFIRNNGADGDDWSHNNVRTWGAGAIGWRVDFTPELAERIRANFARLSA
jgi:hypothetical protein